MSSVREINRIDELEGFADVWEKLLRRTPGATFFQSLDWLKVYWKHYGCDQKLRVLIVSRGGRPTGILPLVLRNEPTKVGTVKALTYPLDDWGSFYGPVGPEPQETLQEGLEHIRKTPWRWGVVELRWIGAPGTDLKQTEEAMRRAGFPAVRSLRDRTSLIDLSGTWEEYMAARKAKWRNNLRRWERNLAKQGEVTYERYRPGGTKENDADPRWDLYETCEHLASLSWQGSSTTGTTLTHESVRGFLRDVHAAAVRTGNADINILRLDGKPLAYAYNYYCNKSVYGLRVGYDAERSRDGAGNILYARIIEDSFRRGDTLYDMGPGSFEAKRHLTTEVAPIYRYTHFHPIAPRAQLLRLGRWVKRRVELQESALV